MLLINFICLFYLMVLVRCDTISKSAANIESFDGVSDAFNVLFTRQDVPDPNPVSRIPKRLLRLRKHKRPWLFTVPINSYQGTATLETILENIKYKNMKQIASSPFGTTGMVFVTQPGYERDINSDSSVRQNLLNKENKFPKIDEDETTTELDELIYIDNLRIKEGKIKRRTESAELDSAKPSKKAKKKFSIKHFFKFLHPGRNKQKHENKPVSQDKQDLLKEVSQLPKDLKANKKKSLGPEDKTETTLVETSVGSVSNASEKIQRHISNKEKAQKHIRHQRTVDMKESQEHKWLPNFIKREPHLESLDSRVYEALSNKLAYKDFVDGYKYYLNFEKDMAKSNFSDMVRYQAHKHHKVDDIGKFILEKLPTVSTTINYENKPSSEQILTLGYEGTDKPVLDQSTYKMEQFNQSADSDYDINLEKYDFMQTTTLPSTPYSLNLLKKRLIEFRRPSWLSKSLNLYSDSKTQSSRGKRHGIRFDTTQFPHSLKTEHALPKDNTKNVGFAKVTLVETAKTKKTYKSLFEKFKKFHSKRDAQRASRSSFMNKLKQLFSNGQSSSPKSRTDAYDGRTDGYDFPSQFYDIMKDQYPFYKASENDLEKMDEKMKKQAEGNTKRFSLDDYEREPSETTVFSANYHVNPDIPFELTTPMVQNPELRKELHRLQQAHDAVSSKVFDEEYEMASQTKPSLKEMEARVTAHNWTKATTTRKLTTSILRTLLEDLESYDDAKDLPKLSHGEGEHLTIERKGPDTIMSSRPTLQHSTKSWEIDYPEFKDKQKDSPQSWENKGPEIENKLKGSSESWTKETESKNKLKEHLLHKSLHKNAQVKNKQAEYQSSKSWQNERENKNNLNYLSKSWQTNELKLKNKQKEHSSKIGQKSDTDAKNKLKEQTSKTWKEMEQELKKVMDYDLDNKANLPEASEVINKANPANHYNIKPSMITTLSIDEMAFRVTDWSKKQNTNSFTTDKIPIDADKTPVRENKMKDIFEKWSKTSIANELKTNKMTIITKKGPELDKKGKAMRDMGFRVRDWSGTRNTDVINLNSMNELKTTDTKDVNNQDGDYMKKANGFDEKQKKTLEQSKYFFGGSHRGTEDDKRRVSLKVRIETNDDSHPKVTGVTSPIHNKLLYNTNPHKDNTQTTRKLLASPVNSLSENMIQKGAHKYKTSEGHGKQQQRLHRPQSTTTNDLNDFRRRLLDLDITVSSTEGEEKTTVTLPYCGSPPMLDKFDQEFPEFKKEGKTADMELLVNEWFDKNYPDMLKTSGPIKEEHRANDLSDIGRVIKNWLEKHDFEYGRTDVKALAKYNPNDKGVKGTTNKTVDIGRLIKDWMDKMDKFDPENAKFKAGQQISNFKKEEITTLDVGRLVKDWLDSFDPDCVKTTTKSANTNDYSSLKTVRHVKDWPDNIDDKSTTTTEKSLKGANDFITSQGLGKPNDFTNLHNNDKLTTTSEKYRYVFEPVQNYDIYGPRAVSPGKNSGHPKPSLKHKIHKSKEKEQSRPGKLQIVKTFDIIYTAHGKMPSDNQSFSKIEAMFKKYSNVKKRNLRKWHMASTTLKLPILRKSRRQKRFTGKSEDITNQEVCPNVTPEPENVDKRVKNRKRETNEKHVVKNVAALEVLMDMMKTNNEVHQTSVEKPTLKSNETTNSVQVHLALPGNIKRSLKRVRKIFTAKLSSPVDLEYQIHSYDDTLETTTSSVLPSGMYLLVDNFNSTSPRGHFVLGPFGISNDLGLSRVLQRQYLKIANPDLENKKAEETTQNDKFSKVTLSKEFVSAVNEHLLQLYEVFANNDTKIDETTRQFSKVTLSSDFMNVNIQRPVELQQSEKDPKVKLHKREIKKGKRALPSRNATKKSIFDSKESNGKPIIPFEICSVNDEIMRSLISEMNNLVEYMHEHCTEIQTYFRNNPSGGRKLRDTVRKVNKLVDKYSKSAAAPNAYYSKTLHKIVGKRHTADDDVSQKYVPSNLIDDIQHLASDINNVTKLSIRFKEKLHDGRNDLVGVVDKCVLDEENRNERSVTNDDDVYSLDKVKVNIICKTEPSSTTPQQMNVHWFVDNEDSLNKKQWSLKNLLWRTKHINKKSKELMSRSWKREVGSIDTPLNADTGGSFWSNYMHKFQKATYIENKRTSGGTEGPANDKKAINQNSTKQDFTTASNSIKNADVLNKCSKGNNEITNLTNHQIGNETTNNTEEADVLPSPTTAAASDSSNPVKKLEPYSNETITNEYLNAKKERKIKPKRKEKHTKMTEFPKPMNNKGKSSVAIDNNQVFNEDDDMNSASAPPTGDHVTNTNSNPTQTTSINSNKDEEHVKEVCSNGDQVDNGAQNIKRLPKEPYTVEVEYQVNTQDEQTASRLGGPCLLLVNCTATLPNGNYLLKLLSPGTFEAVASNAGRRPDLTIEITDETNWSNDLKANREIDVDDKTGNELENERNAIRGKRAFTCRAIRNWFHKRACGCKCKPKKETSKDREKTGKDESERETNENRGKRTAWKKIKKWFHGNRACRCKCKPNKTMCAACAASDAVMMDVIFRLNNLVTYINDHSSEIENYFIINPSGAAEFKEAVKETDKCLENYSKRVKGKCHGKLCEAFKYVQDRVTDYDGSKDLTAHK